jgi:hypothetical protein
VPAPSEPDAFGVAGHACKGVDNVNIHIALHLAVSCPLTRALLLALTEDVVGGCTRYNLPAIVIVTVVRLLAFADVPTSRSGAALNPRQRHGGEPRRRGCRELWQVGGQQDP